MSGGHMVLERRARESRSGPSIGWILLGMIAALLIAGFILFGPEGHTGLVGLALAWWRR